MASSSLLKGWISQMVWDLTRSRIPELPNSRCIDIKLESICSPSIWSPISPSKVFGSGWARSIRIQGESHKKQVVDCDVYFHLKFLVLCNGRRDVLPTPTPTAFCPTNLPARLFLTCFDWPQHLESHSIIFILWRWLSTKLPWYFEIVQTFAFWFTVPSGTRQHADITHTL